MFHLRKDGAEQHAGIAAGVFSDPAKGKGVDTIAGTPVPSDAPMAVYAAASDHGLVERWNKKGAKTWTLSVVGWVKDNEPTDLLYAAVLERARHLALLSEGRSGRSCCWQIRAPYKKPITDEETQSIVFQGSCSGFVEHCYEYAKRDLVDDDGALPLSEFDPDESDELKEEYQEALRETGEPKIARLYPSYQIRALQLDDFPWSPDLGFRRYPRGFFPDDGKKPAPSSGMSKGRRGPK